MAIRFYSTRDQFGEFSNFSAHPVEIDGQWWPTVEHYFQAQKFDSADYRNQIQKAPSPKQAALLGRSRSVPLRSDWENLKEKIMYKAVLTKFQTHTILKTLLLSTDSEEIIEDALGDYYWGGGADGSGKNRLGSILMDVRELLRSEK